MRKEEGEEAGVSPEEVVPMTEFNKPWTHIIKGRVPRHVPMVKETAKYIKYCSGPCKKAVASDMGNPLRPYTILSDGRYICDECKEGRGKHAEK